MTIDDNDCVWPCQECGEVVAHSMECKAWRTVVDAHAQVGIVIPECITIASEPGKVEVREVPV
jgi:hypothetical protein